MFAETGIHDIKDVKIIDRKSKIIKEDTELSEYVSNARIGLELLENFTRDNANQLFTQENAEFVMKNIVAVLTSIGSANVLNNHISKLESKLQRAAAELPQSGSSERSNIIGLNESYRKISKTIFTQGLKSIFDSRYSQVSDAVSYGYIKSSEYEGLKSIVDETQARCEAIYNFFAKQISLRDGVSIHPALKTGEITAQIMPSSIRSKLKNNIDKIRWTLSSDYQKLDDLMVSCRQDETDFKNYLGKIKAVGKVTPDNLDEVKPYFETTESLLSRNKWLSDFFELNEYQTHLSGFNRLHSARTKFRSILDDAPSTERYWSHDQKRHAGIAVERAESLVEKHGWLKKDPSFVKIERITKKIETIREEEIRERERYEIQYR